MDRRRSPQGADRQDTETRDRVTDPGQGVTKARTIPPVPDDVADQAVPLDALLVDAALGPRLRLVPDGSTARFVASLIRRPGATTRRLGDLAVELASICAGTSALAPAPRDRRFNDPAWIENPVLRRVVQAYVAGEQTARQLLADAGLGWRDEQRV